MNKYIVTWKIDIEAETPEAAAREARACQAEGTTSLYFEVAQVTPVDLLYLDVKEEPEEPRELEEPG